MNKKMVNKDSNIFKKRYGLDKFKITKDEQKKLIECEQKKIIKKRQQINLFD